jgi:hypothetical protein
MSDGEHEPSAGAPPRVIGPWAAFSLVAGSMLGIGIFLAPSLVAAQIDSEAAFIGLWAVAGLFALAGAVACAELGAMMPQAGGDLCFSGRFWAFGGLCLGVGAHCRHILRLDRQSGRWPGHLSTAGFVGRH